MNGQASLGFQAFPPLPGSPVLAPKTGTLKSPENKVAFITGGAGGIGLALGRTFLAAGMKVVLADLREDALAKLEPEFAGRPVRFMTLDVTQPEELQKAADETENAFGRVDVLCNNAGVNIFGPVGSTDPQDLNWVLDVNLRGVLNGLAAFLPKIKAQGTGGHILNTASIAAWVGSPRAGIYTASKAAVCALSESLWYELAPLGIGVSVLCPGLVKTEIYRSRELHPTRPESLDAERLREIHEAGMEPMKVAQKAYHAMLKNELFIFTHPEHKHEFVERSERLANLFPEEPVEPAREAFERSRLESQRAALQQGLEGLES